jgi:ribosomal protein S18 acetylase RimI-like enzyme
MHSTTIRKYRKTDEAAVQKITFRTGFQGEDLTGRGFFDDARLFFLVFIYYYARYEPEHFFVAVDDNTDRAVGFICGTPDSALQETRFRKTVVPQIALRTFLFTSWRYPRTFGRVLGYLRRMGSVEDTEKAAALWADYPAHLHIDLLPEYQSMGIGTRLMRRLEKHMIGLNVRGLHLKTTNHNRKAVPFYKKMGFSIVDETRMDDHPMLEDLLLLTFAKKLSD